MNDDRGILGLSARFRPNEDTTSHFPTIMQNHLQNRMFTLLLRKGSEASNYDGGKITFGKCARNAYFILAVKATLITKIVVQFVAKFPFKLMIFKDARQVCFT